MNKKPSMAQNQNTAPSAGLSPLPIKLFVAAAPFVQGMFFEYESALAALLLMGFLLYCRAKNGGLRLGFSPELLFTLSLEGCLLLSFLWARDKGSVAFGLIKFLPLPLFALALQQLQEKDREGSLDLLPPSAAIMVLLSLGLGLVPELKPLVYVVGRLGGFFQYPNSFCIYLLLALIVCLSRAPGQAEVDNSRSIIPSCVCALVLLTGIALSGSRAGIIISLLSLLVLFITGQKKSPSRLMPLLCFALFLFSTGAYALISGDFSSAGRLFTASLSSGTLLERLLYYKDALTVIVRRPLGLGYLGYYRLQGSFQTGIYSSMHVHNELLQTILDGGWLPGALLVYAAVNALVKAKDPARRLAVAALALHSLFDFDLQFASLGFIALCLCPGEGKRGCKQYRAKALPWVCSLLAVLCLWLGAGSWLSWHGKTDAALKLCPFNTTALVSALDSAQTPLEKDRAADRLIKSCPDVYLAYSKKAEAAFSRGNTEAVVANMDKAIELNRYSMELYEDYKEMLTELQELYLQQNDPRGAEYCSRRLALLKAQMQNTLDSSSPLAWQICEKPQLD